MRSVVALAVAVCAVTTIATGVLAAMSPEKIAEERQTDIAVRKVEMLSRAMHLSRAEADAFWPVYRDYEREQEQLNARAKRLIEDYMASYRSLDDARARALLDQLFQLHDQRLELLRRYAVQLQATLPMRQVAGFVLTEFQLQHLLDLQRTSELGIIR